MIDFQQCIWICIDFNDKNLKRIEIGRGGGGGGGGGENELKL